MEQVICLNFSASNNEIEYEAMLAELDLTLILVVARMEVRSDSRLIVERIQQEYETNYECMA